MGEPVVRPGLDVQRVTSRANLHFYLLSLEDEPFTAEGKLYCPKHCCSISRQECFERQRGFLEAADGKTIPFGGAGHDILDSRCRRGECSLGVFIRRMFEKGRLIATPRNIIGSENGQFQFGNIWKRSF